MLQPNQPMGVPNQAATGPQAPKPQGVPAGALMGMMPQGGIMAPIDKVAGAYQGNPQALEQKAVGGDLLAALALQRLKTEKEAAMRQMQMAAAGQQQGPQPTVVDQLEQQALDLTKQEMQAEQVDTLKQKQGQMQQGQQRLMQAAMNPQAGLPGLPAPNAAEPKAMAAGGIVAFAGPTDGSYVDPKEYGNYDPANPSHIQDRIESERERFKAKYGFDPENSGLSGGIGTRIANAMGGTSEEAMALERYRAMKEGAKVAQQAPNRAAPAAAPATPAAPGAQPARPPLPPATPPAAPTAPGGAPAAPGGAPAAGGLNSLLQGAVKQGLSTPEERAAAAKAEREDALKFIGFSPEDEAKRRENLAGLEALDKARFNPEDMRNERIARTLAGAANQSWLGGMGAGMTREATRASDEQYRQEREAAAARNKAFEELIGKTQEIKKEAYGAGQKKEDIMSKDFQQSLASGSAMRNADVQAAVSAMNAAATRETAAAMREANNFTRLQGALTNINRYRETARQKVLEQYPQFGMLSQMDPNKMDKSQKAEYERMRGMIAQDIAIATRGFDEQAAALEERLGYSGKTATGGKPTGTVDTSNPLLNPK